MKLPQLQGHEIGRNLFWKPTCRLPALLPLSVAIEAPDARARVGAGVVYVAVQSEWN